MPVTTTRRIAGDLRTAGTAKGASGRRFVDVFYRIADSQDGLGGIIGDLDPEFLFDISIDTVDLLVPGGGIAIKLAKKGLAVVRAKKS